MQLRAHCKTFAPAISWLQDVWQAISGTRPPATADAIITAQPGGWAPSKLDEPLWHALRLTVLFSIWACRCSPDPTQRNARAAVQNAVEAITADIRLQFNRQFLAKELCRSLPPHVRRMQQRRPQPDTFSVWLRPQLASININAAGRQQLTVHLSTAHPVPCPPPPAGAPN
jgi:hypothetical protein